MYKAFIYLLVISLTLFTVPYAEAEKAKLYPRKSKYAGTNNPTWFVSSRVRADIEEKHLNQGSTTNSTVRRWVQTDVGCPSNDDAGHYIANSLGGNGRVYYNIFPENRTLNRGKQRSWEGKVYDYVASGDCDKARVAVSVTHRRTANPKTRPVRVTYKVRCVGRVEPGKKKSMKTQNWTNNKPANCP